MFDHVLRVAEALLVVQVHDPNNKHVRDDSNMSMRHPLRGPDRALAGGVSQNVEDPGFFSVGDGQALARVRHTLRRPEAVLLGVRAHGINCAHRGLAPFRVSKM